jgi:hypothetical protein
MIPKSGSRFSEKIMLNQKPDQDDDSKKRHPGLDGDLVIDRNSGHNRACRPKLY